MYKIRCNSSDNPNLQVIMLKFAIEFLLHETSLVKTTNSESFFYKVDVLPPAKSTTPNQLIPTPHAS